MYNDFFCGVGVGIFLEQHLRGLNTFIENIFNSQLMLFLHFFLLWATRLLLGPNPENPPAAGRCCKVKLFVPCAYIVDAEKSMKEKSR